MIKKAFGKNLKKLRKERRMTQEQLSEMVGIHPRQISKIETGENFPNSKTLENLCNALDLEPQELFNFNKPAQPTRRKTMIKLIEKIENISDDKSVLNFINLAIGALQNNDDLEKLEMLISGIKLARK